LKESELTLANFFCFCFVCFFVVSRVLIAGAAASTTRAIIETPLELAKVELQLQVSVFSTIFRVHGTNTAGQ